MDWLGYAVYRLTAAVLRMFSIGAVFRIGAAAGTFAYYIAPPYRRLALRNLQIAFGGEKSLPELKTLAREHFTRLGANLFSSLKIPHMSREEISALVEVEGLEHIAAGQQQGRGFVMVIGHIGNWELFAQSSAISFPCPVGTIYQALGNPLIDAEVRRSRSVLGLQLFGRKEGFGKAGQFIRSGGAVGILVDQHAGDAGLWCSFFGRLASTSTLAGTLALRTDALVVPAVLNTVGTARWRFSVLPPLGTAGHTAEEITLHANTALEGLIRREPADWFWVHNRWKLPRPKFLLSTYKRGVAVRGDQRLQPFRIVIRASNWLGDAVMSVPAVRAIKRGRPDAHVAILTPGKFTDFWEAVPEVDEVIAIEQGDTVFAVARKLRGRFEAAIIFPNSFRTALEPWLAGIPRRVGFPGHRRAALLNQVLRDKKKKPAPRPQHHVQHYLRLAEFVGADIAKTAAAPDAKRHWTLNQRPTISVCPGAEYGPAKRWPAERFAAAAAMVQSRRACDWKIVGVTKDLPVAQEIIAAGGVQYTNLVGKTTLAQLVDEICTSDVLLTNDTGTMHLAAHFGVPVVAIFGSTEPALTGPVGSGHAVLRHHVPCSPCFLRGCPLDFRCMTAVTPEEAAAALQRIIDTRGGMPARAAGH